MLNSGDIGYAATNARAMAKAKRPRSLDLLKPKKEKASVMKSPSPRTAGRSRRTRRRTVVIEESESEDDDLEKDEMMLDAEDYRRDEVEIEASPKMSAVRRGKQREVLQLQQPVQGDYVGASGLREPFTSPVKYPDLDTILEEADAANSLLELAAGSHGGSSNTFTPVNTGNTYDTLPGINLTSYGNGPRCGTVYSPVSPSHITTKAFSTQPAMKNQDLPSAWYNVSANGTDLPISHQTHPYPAYPEVTSTTIGHDSQGTCPQNAQSYNPTTGGSNTTFATTDLTSSPDHFSQQVTGEQTLFIDPASSDEPATSAPLLDDDICSSAATTATNDENWQAWLKNFRPNPEKLSSALSIMGDGMDKRGARLFGNDASGEVWNDDLFNENYFDHMQDGIGGGRAVAKVNLDVGFRSRARRACTRRQQEGSEEGEIMEDDGMDSG